MTTKISKLLSDSGTPASTPSHHDSVDCKSQSLSSYGTATPVTFHVETETNHSSAHTPTNESTTLLGEIRKYDSDKFNLRAVLEETWVLGEHAIPVICTTLLEYLFNMVPIVIVGHLSTTMLAGATLAALTICVTGYSVIQGLASVLDSILPQAWTSEHPSHVGLWTQRMLVLMAMIIPAIITLWYNIQPILLHLGQDPEVAKLAALYMKRYLQAQGLLHIPSVITGAVAFLNIPLSYFLVWGPEPVRLGFIGAPVASAISINVMSAMYIVYGVCLAPRSAWHPITPESFTCLPSLFKMGVIGVGQCAAEWCSMEFMSLAASQLGTTTLAAQSVIVTVATTTYVVQYSLGMVAAVRVGNLLGSGDARQARVSARGATLLTFLVGASFGGLFCLLRQKIAYLFVEDHDVVALVATVMPVISIYQIMDGVASVEAGILCACGKLGTVAVLNFIAYYIIGLPLGIAFGLWSNLGLLGLWVGFTIALFWAGTTLSISVLRLDWDVEVREAKERIGSSGSSFAESDQV